MNRKGTYENKRRKSAVKQWQRIVSALSCIVVFVTTYALILPVITIENKTAQSLVCGMEEHTHTDDCYKFVTVCGMEDVTQHTHTQACYTLICGEESPDHEHSDECYVLGADCAGGHIHTESCTEKQLVCALAEHTHSDECYNSIIDIKEQAQTNYDNSYIEKLPVLTGVWADDLVAAAASQLGYVESTDVTAHTEDGEKGYTMYGKSYGMPYEDWCALFVKWCLEYVGIPDAVPANIETLMAVDKKDAEKQSVIVPSDPLCGIWIEKLEALEMYRAARQVVKTYTAEELRTAVESGEVTEKDLAQLGITAEKLEEKLR